MRKVLAGILAAMLALSSSVSAAGNRTNFYYAEQPASSKLNQTQRYVRLGDGALMQTLFGNGNGGFNNLTVTAAGGLTVAVGPASSTVGTLYQFHVDDATPYGGGTQGPSTALPADSTQIVVEGTATANTPAIGPLTVPGSNSQISLIECQVNTFAGTGTPTNFINSFGKTISSSVNRDTLDTISCQAKAGTPAPSPTVPAVDTGYVGVGYVTIPSGTVTVTGGMITALTPIGLTNGGVQTFGPGQMTYGSISCSNTAVAPCLASDGTFISLSPKNSGALYFGYNTTSLSSINFGPVAGWGIMTSSAFTLGSGLGMSFNSNPGGGTQATLNDYEVGTWAPADQSGASLTLTVNAANYVKNGRTVFFTLDVTYPSTAASNANRISTPFTCNGQATGLSLGLTTSSLTGPIVYMSSACQIILTTPPGVNGYADSSLSTFRFVISGSYESST